MDQEGEGEERGWPGRWVHSRIPFGGLLKFFILGLIRRRGGMSGVEIIRAIEERTGVWKPSPGSVYPALRELERMGLLTSREKGKMRKYYLTPAGEEAWNRLKDAQRRILRDFRDLAESVRNLLGEPAGGGIPEPVRCALAELRSALSEADLAGGRAEEAAAVIREAAERVRELGG